jgi:NAD(P)-dependent dehydrogenase (short-subunit alcohol dehydrogenase family)
LFASESGREAMNARYPLQRVGDADEVAAIADFLLTPESSWITGQTIGIDGGVSRLRK